MHYAICNETFEGWPHARVCQFVAELGYSGLEIAPFTLASSVVEISPGQRLGLRLATEHEGISIIGLHWLLAKTTGLQLTAREAPVRAATANYLAELARLCADLGGHLMVLGSPAQRRVPQGASLAEATDYAFDTLQRLGPVLADCGVTLCVEPLSPPEADFLNTAAQTVALLDRLDHPNFRLHLDVKAMSTDEAPAPELIRRHASRLAHFHANDPNLRGPGFGATDFRPICAALREIDYKGWVSVEVFDYSPDPQTIAQQSIDYLRRCALP